MCALRAQSGIMNVWALSQSRSGGNWGEAVAMMCGHFLKRCMFHGCNVRQTGFNESEKHIFPGLATSQEKIRVVLSECIQHPLHCGPLNAGMCVRVIDILKLVLSNQ